MTPPLIHAAISKLRRAAANPQAAKWLTESDRALLALADLVDLTITTIDGPARREMTDPQLRLICDLAEAVPRSKETSIP